MHGYVVVDFETTGFSPRKGDRVIEIGLVKLDRRGNFVDQWETLVNPGRDVGATHVHGISQFDVAQAPQFVEIADLFASELSGNVFVAHNASFDAGFALAELTRAGRLEATAIPYLDTMRLARQFLRLPKVTLESVCAELQVLNRQAHSALSDAQATAEVLQRFMATPGALDSRQWQDAIWRTTSFSGYRIQDATSSKAALCPRN